MCLAFSKTNVITKCIEFNSRDNLEHILTRHPNIKILNSQDLFFKDVLLSQIKEDNSLINRLNIDHEDNLLVFFNLYKERG